MEYLNLEAGPDVVTSETNVLRRPVDVRVRDVSLVLSVRRLVWHGDRARVVAPKALCNRYTYYICIINRAQRIARDQPMAPEANQAR